MIRLQLEYNTAEDAMLALACLREKGYDVPGADGNKARPTVTDKGVTKVTKEKEKETPARKSAASTDTNAGSSPTAGQKTDAAPVTKAADTSGSSTAVEYSTVTSAITKAVADHGRDKMIALLAEFGAKSGKDLKPEQYGDLLTKIEGLGGDLT